MHAHGGSVAPPVVAVFAIGPLPKILRRRVLVLTDRGDSAVLGEFGLGLDGIIHVVGIIRGTTLAVLVDGLFLV